MPCHTREQPPPDFVNHASFLRSLQPCLPEAEAEAKIDKKTGSEIERRPSADVTGLEESCCRLQESNDRLQCCIEEFQKEVNEVRTPDKTVYL